MDLDDVDAARTEGTGEVGEFARLVGRLDEKLVAHMSLRQRRTARWIWWGGDG